MSKMKSERETARVIRKRRKTLYMKKSYISLMARVLILVLVGYILFTEVFLFTRANGNDMFPAIKDGDLVIAFRLNKEYVKGDVAVYDVDGSRHIGRIVARETDVVNLDSSGTLMVNSTIQNKEILYPTFSKEVLSYPLTVDDGRIFLLGDYRVEAYDSRDFGPINVKQIKGKVITILRRRGI